jgi:hypothetical protein
MLEALTNASNVGIAILCINTIIYFTGFTKNGKAFKCFTLYLLCIFIIQVSMEVLAYNGLNNHFISGYYLFLQFSLLSVFFYQLFLPINIVKSNVIKYLSVTVIAGIVMQYVFNPGLYYVFNSVGFLITSLVLIIYSVLYIFELVTRRLHFNFVAVGAFIYLVSSVIIFASSVYLSTINEDVFMVIWLINAVLFILYQLLIFWEWKQHFLPKTIK